MWIDIADYLRLFSDRSDHLHIEQINVLGFLDELTYGHRMVWYDERALEVEPQLLLHCVLALLPLDQSSQEGLLHCHW